MIMCNYLTITESMQIVIAMFNNRPDAIEV